MGILKNLKILMAQENMGDWMEYAREYAKAQREIKIEKWVCITIEYRTKERQRVVLFRYDLPHDIYERANGLSDGAMPDSCANIPKRTFRHISHIMTGAPD